MSATTRRRLLKRASILKRLAQRQQGVLLPDGESVWQAGGDRVETSGSDASASFVIVTRSAEPNRHGNKVQIVADERGRGILTANFERNPIVLFEHGLNPKFSAPIGAARKDKTSPAEIRLQKSKATSKVYFDQGSAQAMDIFRMTDAGLLNMASIGFRPNLATAISRKPRKLDDGVEDLDRWGGLDFVESDLWEWSVVAIGADPGALRQTLERQKVGGEKLHSPALEWLRSLGLEYQRVWFPSADIPDTPAGQIVKQFGVSLQGQKAAEFLQALDDRIAAPAPQQAPAEENPKTPVDQPVQSLTMPAFTGEELAAAYRQGAKPTLAEQVTAALPGIVEQSISESVTPILEGARTLVKELDRKTGRLV